MKKANIGFIGLGNMGGPMAKNIVKAGYPLAVFDLKKELVAALIKDGAVGKASPKEVGEASEIILTSLPTLEASEAVWLGRGGVLEGAKPKSILVELSTVSPDFVRSLYARAFGKGTGVVNARGFKRAEDVIQKVM
jgi:3-hydroxyisobutyrate dehydrogenase-like beta-hydroxyacid dehydrogenase